MHSAEDAALVERAQRRAALLRDLAAGRELRARLHPRRTRLERAREAVHRRTSRL